MRLAKKSQAGMSLLEITMVLGLTLGLITALMFGIQAYQDAGDRAKCIIQLTNIQTALRSFQNLYEYRPEETFVGGGANNEGGNDGTIGKTLAEQIFGDGKFLTKKPTCPKAINGTADYISFGNGDTFPPVGTMWQTCPNEALLGHRPKDIKNL